MQPVKFKECNAVFGKGQKEYNPLPVLSDIESGIVISCYKLSIKELIKIIFTRKIWLGIMTFNTSLQPQKMSINKSEFIK